MPAIQNSWHDFSVRLLFRYLTTARKTSSRWFTAIIPSLGDTALRIAAMYNVPVVFQHHVMYERYALRAWDRR